MFVPIIVILVALVMMGVEITRPGRKWPKVTGWWVRMAILNAFQVFVIWLSGILWDGWMLKHRLWSAEWMGPNWGGLMGYLAITFVFYWWHRARHHYDFLWLGFHQVHHSPQRIEVITSFYKHPFELLANGVICSTILYLICGLDPAGASVAILLSGLAELFYHWNVKTPVWLGYLFQRPESHCVHHKYGHHTSNFGDLPLWDILFGTFDNPKEDFTDECGFGDANEHRLGEMIMCVDVNKVDPDAAVDPKGKEKP